MCAHVSVSDQGYVAKMRQAAASVDFSDSFLVPYTYPVHTHKQAAQGLYMWGGVGGKIQLLNIAQLESNLNHKDTWANTTKSNFMSP